MDMKKLSIYALAVASMIGALEAESLSLITGENGEISEKFDWNDTSKWTPTVSEVAGNDLNLNFSTTTEVTSTINAGFTAGDVVVNVKQNAPSASVGGKGHFFVNIEGDTTFDSLTYNMTSPAWWGSYIRIKTGSTLTINNDLYAGNSGTNANFINFASNNLPDYMGNIYVKGNLVFTSNAPGPQTHALWTQLGNFTVNGAFVMKAANVGDTGRWRISNGKTTIGGLSGESTSVHQIYIDNDTSITFTNKSDYSWNGSITDVDGGAANAKKLNIVMDASATGKQTMSITNGSLNDITINGGKFILSSTTATTGKVSLNGGYFGVGNKSTAINSAEWNSGGLLFDMAAIENGYKITIENAFTKNGDGLIEIDFDGLNGAYYIDYDAFELLSAGSLEGFDVDDANANFVAKNLYGALADFVWDGNSLFVTFTQIPEPAALAAIIGAAALILALRRRRG